MRITEGLDMSANGLKGKLGGNFYKAAGALLLIPVTFALVAAGGEQTWEGAAAFLNVVFFSHP